MPTETKPFRFGDVLARFKKRYDASNRKIRRLEAEIKALNAELEKARKRRPHWIDSIIRPIGKALLAEMPDRRMDILGPFGLCCEVGLHLYKKDSPREKELEDCLSLSFVHDEERGAEVRNYRENTGAYRDGTLGQVNGMNHPRIAILDDADVVWFRKHFEDEE